MFLDDIISPPCSELIKRFSAEAVFRRQNLTSNVGHRSEMVNEFRTGWIYYVFYLDILFTSKMR